ncbi:hypothetical protein PC115_g19533 [Phytophthora cactorum]|uniref:Uncharacterized protein n=1 Tax=Phytophthora cactorum TaxID=29920 RepID=A0A8T1AWA5_9STRA|nr:hypothetical protein PC115_g19533 [Phytophthora cactorum]
MRYCYLFLLLALYPPTDNSAAHHKLKTSVQQARLQKLSAFIEEMGCYALLAAFEGTVHDNLMWFGAKHASGVKYSGSDSDQEHLGSLCSRNTVANTTVSLPVLWSQALDPTRPKNLRHSDDALARIVLDVSGNNPPKDSWVDNCTCGPWKKLNPDRSLRVAWLEVAKRLKAGDDDSDFEEDGEFTATKPSPPVAYQYPNSPARLLKEYLDFSSDDEEHLHCGGKHCFDEKDQDDQEEDQEKIQENPEQEAEDQTEEKEGFEAVEQTSSTDNGSKPTTADSNKTSYTPSHRLLLPHPKMPSDGHHSVKNASQISIFLVAPSVPSVAIQVKK